MPEVSKSIRLLEEVIKMAYAKTRSCNRELHYGITDGAYKDSHINWANIQGDHTPDQRQQMSTVWHGFDEAPVKYLPDGRSYTTKGHAEIAPTGDREWLYN